MTIGEKIYKYRKQAGLSQEELADKMNVSRQSVSLWETDQTTPSVDKLVMLAEIFSVSMDELCGTSEKINAQPSIQEKPTCLVSVTTKYTVDLFKHVYKIASKKFNLIIFILIVLLTLISIDVITSDNDNLELILPIFLIILLASLFIRNKLQIKRRITELQSNPNIVANIMFFRDYFNLETTSDKANSNWSVPYSDVKKVINDEKYILIYFGNTFVPVEKNQSDINYDFILKLLNVSGGNTKIPQSGKVKKLLNVMFVLSLLSIFIAMAIVVICIESSPLPDFPSVMLEYIWTLLLVIPLPLSSAILGIIFSKKKYRCKKNIIAGFIMSALLLIYGSIGFAFKDMNIHDFGYVNELEQTIDIDLPNSGYISREKNRLDYIKNFAMIKFDDADEIFEIVSADKRFVTDTDFMPLNFIDYFHTTYTSDNDYFMLYDVTFNKVNTVSPYVEHRYIFIAYNVEKNVMLVIDFVK